MKQSNYFHRDLSWLEFNRRVLQEAENETTPLLERAQFLAIVSSNLDEFMSVRVACLMEKVNRGALREDFAGFAPPELLACVLERAGALVMEQYKLYRQLADRLASEGIALTEYRGLTPEQKTEMETYFRRQVLPILTPMAIDQSRPFPLVHTQSLYLAIALSHAAQSKEQSPYFALLQIPSNLPRVIPVSARAADGKSTFLLLEQLIKAHLGILFEGYQLSGVQVFRVTRNADLMLDEEGIEDLLDEVEKKLRHRKRGAPVRLEIEGSDDRSTLAFLCKELQLSSNIVIADGPVDLSFLSGFARSLKGYETLRYLPHRPIYPREFADTDDFFSVLGKQDVMVLHPFESFEAVDDFVWNAASDPAVLAIKMTLYRVSGNSRIVRSLAQAAENGKQVTVVLELKARFDEERNIAWAKQLEQAGCHVVYGLVGLKIHAKMTLIVRQEGEVLRRYAHISTGNYNGKTANVYTDIGLFTSRPDIGDDVAGLFNEISGFSTARSWQTVVVAPESLRQTVYSLIQREMRNAASGKPARIVGKMNSLSDPCMIDQLYEASRAGVKIDLVVRGICCLRPGIAGLSENIAVRSIVDRFLEHSRIYCFENGGQPEVWLSSADWMTRNLSRRIELMCPVLDDKLKQVVIQYLTLLLNDNVKARRLFADGTYRMAEQGSETIRSQFEMQPILQEKYRFSLPEERHLAYDAMIEGDSAIPQLYH